MQALQPTPPSTTFRRFSAHEAVALHGELGIRALRDLAHESVRPDAAITTRCLVAWRESVRLQYREALHIATWHPERNPMNYAPGHLTGGDCPRCGDIHDNEGGDL